MTEWRWTDERGVQRLVGTEELRAALSSQVLPLTTLVWREGMKEWAPASSIPELSGAKAPADARKGPAPRARPTPPPPRKEQKTLVGMPSPDADAPTAPPSMPIVVPSPGGPPEPGRAVITQIPKFGAPEAEGRAASPEIPKAPRLPAPSGLKDRSKPQRKLTTNDIDGLWANPASDDDYTQPMVRTAELQAARKPAVAPQEPEAAEAPKPAPSATLSKDQTVEKAAAPSEPTAPAEAPPAAAEAELEKTGATPAPPAADVPPPEPAPEKATAAPLHPKPAAAEPPREKRPATPPPPRVTETLKLPALTRDISSRPPPPLKAAEPAAAKEPPQRPPLPALRKDGPLKGPPPVPPKKTRPPAPAPAASEQASQGSQAAAAERAQEAMNLAELLPEEDTLSGAPGPRPPLGPRARKPGLPEPTVAASAAAPLAVSASPQPAPIAVSASPQPAPLAASAPPRLSPSSAPPRLSPSASEPLPRPPLVQRELSPRPPQVQPAPAAASPAAAHEPFVWAAPGRAALPPAPPAETPLPRPAVSPQPPPVAPLPADAAPLAASAAPRLAPLAASAAPRLAPLAASAAPGLAPVAASAPPQISPVAAPNDQPSTPPPRFTPQAPPPTAARGASPAEPRSPAQPSPSYNAAQARLPASPGPRDHALAFAPQINQPVAVPVSSLLGAGGALIFMVIGAFFVGRCSTTEPKLVARPMFHAIPAMARAALPPPPKPCWVVRQPVMWAPKASKSIPFDVVAITPGALAVGYARDAGEAVGIEVSAASGEVQQRFNQKVKGDIDRVTPMSSAEFQVITAQGGGTLTSAVPVPVTKPFFIGIHGGAIAAADQPDGTPTSLWPISGSEGISAARVQITGDRGYALTFRREGAIWSGWLGPDRKPVGAALTKVTGSGGAVGKPNSGWNRRELAVIFADKPEGSAHWEIRVGHAPTGQVPATTAVIPLPKGGPGGDAFAPDIAGLPDGRWLMVWTEGPAGSRAIRAQTFAFDFSPLGDPIALSPPAGNFGQGVLGVVENYAGAVFLSKGSSSYELWGSILQCG